VGKPPAFPMYASDFLVDTAGWSAEQVGIYTRLLLYEWVNGYIPDDLKQIRRIAQCASKGFPSRWFSIGLKFTQVGVGKLQNPRMEAVREDMLKYRETQRIQGIKGVEARQKKRTDRLTDGSTQGSTDGLTSSLSLSPSYKTVKNPPTPLAQSMGFHVEEIKQVFDAFNYHVHPENPLKVGDPECDRGMKYANERLSDGYSVADLCHVIEVMTEAWTGDLRMRQYLRPEVLFSKAKFAGYLSKRTHAQEGAAWAAEMDAKQANKEERDGKG
jgi:uncharacterized phage protein (TIGR02220 family)